MREKHKIVSNAGGLNPKSMAAEIENILSELGVDLKVAYIDGDNLLDDLDARKQMAKPLPTSTLRKIWRIRTRRH